MPASGTPYNSFKTTIIVPFRYKFSISLGKYAKIWR